MRAMTLSFLVNKLDASVPEALDVFRCLGIFFLFALPL